MRHLLTVLLLLISMTANAIPVTWTLENVVFEDGGTVVGSYTYDAETNTYTNVSITTTGFGDFPGSLFDDACNVSTCHPDYIDSRPVFEIANGANLERIVVLSLEGAMTNSGGVLDILVGGTGNDISAEWDDILRRRNVVSGSVSAVPVPATAWLFGSAIAGLGWYRRNQKVHA